MGHRTTKFRIEAGSDKTKLLDNSGNSYTAFFYHAFRNILIISIPLVIISAIILSSFHISATGSSSGSTSSTDSLSFSISSSCTLSSVVDSSHTAELINGTYTNGIGKTTITTLCNDGNGYSVYAVGYSNNEEGNNRLVNTESSNFNIVSGTAESGDTSNWAMKLSLKEGDTSTTPPTIIPPFDNYATVPITWTKVATIPSSTTDMEKGSNFTTTYATYISPTQAAGTYLGQVKYLLTHPSAVEPGTNYFIMQEVANWKNDLDEEESVQAIDIRDGKIYWATKLKDGHIWMTQNLDFDIDTTRTYTHNDTDLGWDPNSFDSNATWKPDTTNGRYNLPVDGTSVPGWSNKNSYPYSADPGDVYYYTSNSEADDIKYTSLSNCTSAGHTAGECKHYHAGNYYNWTTAIASNNSSSLTTQYANAPNSICPKGWRLPIATNANQSVYEFGELLYQQGIITTKTSTSYTENGFNNIRKAPLWLARSGYVFSGTLYPGSNGRYWSSTVINGSDAYDFSFTASTVIPTSSNLKNRGWLVRCLAR